MVEQLRSGENTLTAMDWGSAGKQ